MTDHLRPVSGLTALCVAALLALASQPAAGQGPRSQTGDRIVLHEDAPERYVVVRGDTLWDISAKFLRDPWLWPEVWEINPQIDNPHLIYPGDVIYLVWVDGRPRLRLERDDVVKLSPEVRESPLVDPVPVIPLEAIRPFLLRSQVITRDELEAAPYIMRSRDGNLLSGEGHRIYVRGMPADVESRYTVIREGEPFRDPDNDRVLAYEATYVGEAMMERTGDPATAVLTSSQREARAGDRLIPLAGQALDRGIQPQAPWAVIEGRVIRRMGGEGYLGKYGVAAINRGSEDGLKPGHVLSIWRPGKQAYDEAPRGMRQSRSVQLPDERIGEMLMFRVSPRVSYGLVMRTTEEIAAGDHVRNP